MSKCEVPVKSRFKKYSPVFHLQTKESDAKELTAHVIKAARKSGQLSLSGKGLASVPDKVWTLDSLDEAEVRLLDVRLDANTDDQWWQNVPLTTLDLSSNSLLSLPPDIKNLYALTTLNLQDNGLISLPAEIGELTNLTSLNVSHNRLDSLPKTMWHLTELRTLDASHNFLEEISENIADLVMLQKLDLSHNKLRMLHPGIGFLIRLIHVDLSHNQLGEMPPDMVNLRVLLELCLNHNQIKSVPPMGELRRMEILHLDNNHLTEFPNFTGCEALKEIHINGNIIQVIDQDCLTGLSQLRVINLRDNRITDLPSELASLQHLVHLDLTNNKLKTVPSTLALLPHLQTLNLHGNPLQTIRQDLVKCGTVRLMKHLKRCLDADAEKIVQDVEGMTITPVGNFPDKYSMKCGRVLNLAGQDLRDVPREVFSEALEADVSVVDLSKNQFKEIPSGLELMIPKVSDLNMCGNMLTTVPDFLGAFPNLQYLDLERNKLSDLPRTFGALKRLKELVLAHNRFSKIPSCIFELNGLEILKINDNQLAEIPAEGLLNLKFLAVLNLSNNSIMQVSPLLGKMTQLRTLELSGNPFRQPRYAILEKGTAEILSYLRDRIPRNES